MEDFESYHQPEQTTTSNQRDSQAESSKRGSSLNSNSQSAAPSPIADQDASSDISDEDDMPDYSILSSLVKKSKQQSLDAAGATSGVIANPHIPKRGEKDFEPTGVAGQNKALEKSRMAMLEAISGERRVASKALSFAIWDPTKNRAVVHSFKGQMFSSIGLTVRRNSPQTSPSNSKPKIITTFELLPEETLYLIERGVLQCCIEVSDPSSSGSRTRDPDFIKFAKSGMGLNEKVLEDYDLEKLIPMTVQEAFARILGKDGCTRERYQVYAYCKRLGYIVQRASITDELRATVASNIKGTSVKLESDSEGPRCPLHASNLLTKLLSSLRAILYSPISLIRALERRLRQSVGWIRETVTRVLKKEKKPVRGTGLLGIGGRQWDSFDSVYSKLQIIPSGHDRPHSYPRSKEKSLEVAFPVFYYAWRPATHYKKSSPPLPEFRISIADARTTFLPNSFEFTEMFEQVPIPGLDLEDEDAKIAKEQKMKNDEAYGRKAAAKLREKEKERKLKREGKEAPEIKRIEKKFWDLDLNLKALEPFIDLWNHLPPGCSSSRKTFVQKPRPPNPFPPLKAGRRNVVVAVVDNGTTSMLRFGESEFEKWRLAGEGGPGKGE